jgi:hypothetical protein
MDCENIQRKISEWVDDELKKDEEERVFTHLGTCPRCRDFLKITVNLRTDLLKPSGIPTPEFTLARRLENSLQLKSNRMEYLPVYLPLQRATIPLSVKISFLLAFLLAISFFSTPTSMNGRQENSSSFESRESIR